MTFDLQSKIESNELNLDSIANDDPLQYDDLMSKLVSIYKETIIESLKKLFNGNENFENSKFVTHCVKFMKKIAEKNIQDSDLEIKPKADEIAFRFAVLEQKQNALNALKNKIEETTDIASKNVIIDQFNTQAATYRTEVNEYNILKIDIEEKQKSKKRLIEIYNNIVNDQEKCTRIFNGAYDHIFKRKLVNEQKQLIATENLIKEELKKYYLQIISLQDDEANFLIQVMMNTLKNINDVNSAFNVNKSIQILNISKEIHQAIENSPGEFVEKISSFYEEMIRSSLLA